MGKEFDEKKIRKLACDCGYEIHAVGKVDSTNSILKRMAAEGVSEGYLLMAREQTAGRGRLGRSFFSPESGIYMSLLLRPCISPEKTLYLTTAAAVAVCRAIESASGIKAQIKWVNDVYIGERKVCGILTEAAIEGGVTCWAVVGIGINIESPKGGFPEEIKERACALFDCGEVPSGFEERFAAALALELERVYKSDKSEVSREYRERSMLIGRKIITSGTDGERECVAVNITDDAELEVEYPNGDRKKLYSGEVRIIIEH